MKKTRSLTNISLAAYGRMSSNRMNVGIFTSIRLHFCYIYSGHESEFITVVHGKSSLTIMTKQLQGLLVQSLTHRGLMQRFLQCWSVPLNGCSVPTVMFLYTVLLHGYSVNVDGRSVPLNRCSVPLHGCSVLILMQCPSTLMQCSYTWMQCSSTRMQCCIRPCRWLVRLSVEDSETSQVCC